MKNSSIKKSVDRLLDRCIELGASDMHLTSDSPVSYRVSGVLNPDSEEPISGSAASELVRAMMTESQYEEFVTQRTVDIGYTSSAGERFRINCYHEMGQAAIAARHLNQNLLTFDDLGLPTALRELAHLKSGLVLVTGVTGSGKSTSLAALLDEINRTRNSHILTIEDPVEFVHKNKKSLVHHREIHTDVPSFSAAVRAAMREDPDVIMVGEMRDLETMQASIVAAETGHLVFSTLHTGTAVGAVERFIGGFPGEEQSAARHRFSMVLRAVIAQHLLPSRDGVGRVPALELLKVNHAAGHLIRSSKTEQIRSVMEAGKSEGMWTLDQHLAHLVATEKISWDVAEQHCANWDQFPGLVSIAESEGESRWQ